MQEKSFLSGKVFEQPNEGPSSFQIMPGRKEHAGTFTPSQYMLSHGGMGGGMGGGREGISADAQLGEKGRGGEDAKGGGGRPAEGQRDRKCVCECVCLRECVCVCVCERERVCERQSECVGVRERA